MCWYFFGNAVLYKKQLKKICIVLPRTQTWWVYYVMSKL
ncbi:unnamed protein product, partial [Arabidopsis halleri]